jgi:predicted glycosyltransferase
MKVWIDILTPKQALFFMNLSLKLKEKGHQVIQTTRRYREVNQLIKAKGLKAKVVGKHGGKDLYKKLISSVERIINLAALIKKISPDIAISFSSVEASRVAFGLNIPHYCVSDSPHAEAVSKLTIPLSKKLFTPFVVPKNAWVKYGISKENIIYYNALDPIAWLKNFKINKNVLSMLNLNEDKPIIAVRPEESFAAYLLNKKESAIIKVIHLLIEKTDAQIVVLPRYQEQIFFLKKEFKNVENVKIAEKIIDGASLLGLSSVFIGAGGTMTAEAALIGTPTISCFPSKPTYVEKFLIKKGLVKRSLNPKNIVKLALKYIEDKNVRREISQKAKALTLKMEDPTNIILEKILILK